MKAHLRYLKDKPLEEQVYGLRADLQETRTILAQYKRKARNAEKVRDIVIIRGKQATVYLP